MPTRCRCRADAGTHPRFVNAFFVSRASAPSVQRGRTCAARAPAPRRGASRVAPRPCRGSSDRRGPRRGGVGSDGEAPSSPSRPSTARLAPGRRRRRRPPPARPRAPGAGAPRPQPRGPAHCRSAEAAYASAHAPSASSTAAIVAPSSSSRQEEVPRRTSRPRGPQHPSPRHDAWPSARSMRRAECSRARARVRRRARVPRGLRRPPPRGPTGVDVRSEGVRGLATKGRGEPAARHRAASLELGADEASCSTGSRRAMHPRARRSAPTVRHARDADAGSAAARSGWTRALLARTPRSRAPRRRAATRARGRAARSASGTELAGPAPWRARPGLPPLLRRTSERRPRPRGRRLRRAACGARSARPRCSRTSRARDAPRAVRAAQRGTPRRGARARRTCSDGGAADASRRHDGGALRGRGLATRGRACVEAAKLPREVGPAAPRRSASLVRTRKARCATSSADARARCPGARRGRAQLRGDGRRSRRRASAGGAHLGLRGRCRRGRRRARPSKSAATASAASHAAAGRRAERRSRAGCARGGVGARRRGTRRRRRGGRRRRQGGGAKRVRVRRVGMRRAEGHARGRARHCACASARQRCQRRADSGGTVGARIGRASAARAARHLRRMGLATARPTAAWLWRARGLAPRSSAYEHAPRPRAASLRARREGYLDDRRSRRPSSRPAERSGLRRSMRRSLFSQQLTLETRACAPPRRGVAVAPPPRASSRSRACAADACARVRAAACLPDRRGRPL